MKIQDVKEGMQLVVNLPDPERYSEYRYLVTSDMFDRHNSVVTVRLIDRLNCIRLVEDTNYRYWSADMFVPLHPYLDSKEDTNES